MSRILATLKDNNGNAVDEDNGDDVSARPGMRERLGNLFGLGRKVSPGDALMAGLGVSLAVVCALFPWYIFYNPDKFGIRALKFEGNQFSSRPSSLNPQPTLVGQPLSVGDIPAMEIDLFSTATLPGRGEEQDAVALSEQPFPADTVEYRLIHVANGRAMIEDEDGIWIVQPGSRLPDSSRVSAIERRDGRWVIVTSLDRIVEQDP